MISRGFIIGKIVDDLSSLKYQIDTRNKLGLFDLPKFCEDFFREILNITYKLNLKNLNQSRSNFPGLDLGDERGGVAYQITSQNNSTKVNETLAAIKPEQTAIFTKIQVLILGKKQGRYTLNEPLAESYNFTEKGNIKDIDDLLRDIIVLDTDELNDLKRLFEQEFRQVKIELEPVDENGNFQSSYYNTLERKPSSPPKNGILFLGDPGEIKGHDQEFKKLLALYDKLSSVPRSTREVVAIVVEKGQRNPGPFLSDVYGILPKALEKFMNISENELLAEVNILEQAGLIRVAQSSINDRDAHFITTRGEYLNYIIDYALENDLSLKTLFNTMDFTVLDK